RERRRERDTSHILWRRWRIIRRCGEKETRSLAAAAGRRLRNYLNVMTLECQTLARACGKSHVLNLEPEDLCALTMEAAAMAKVPLAGTDWYPGKPGF
ncbi:MAG: hypothetical protein ACPH5G_18815, partial [Pseudooceanicola atlanticus]